MALITHNISTWKLSFNLLKVFTPICNSFLSQECTALLKGVSGGVYLVKILSKVQHLAVHCYKGRKRFRDPTLTFLKVLGLSDLPSAHSNCWTAATKTKQRVFWFLVSCISSVKGHERWTVTGTGTRGRCRTEKQELVGSGNRRLTSVLEELKHMHIYQQSPVLSPSRPNCLDWPWITAFLCLLYYKNPYPQLPLTVSSF